MSDSERRARFIAYFNAAPLNGDRQKLVKKSGYTEGRISQFFDTDESFGERAAGNLAERLGLARTAFLRDPVASAPSVGTSLRGLAHDLSDSPLTFFPTKIEWRGVMDDSLPEVFALQMLDDSMDDDYEQGDWVFFKKLKPDDIPEAGRRVLVVDRDGNGYIRTYRRKGGKNWEAVAKNKNYLPLDSVGDGLRALAVAHGSWRD